MDAQPTAPESRLPPILCTAGRWLRTLAIGLWSFWICGALWFAPLPRPIAAASLMLFVCAGMILARRYGWKPLPVLLGAVTMIWMLAVRPSNDRIWTPDQSRLPRIAFDPGSVAIVGIRDCTYRSVGDYDVRLFDRTIPLESVESVWFVLEPFSEWEGAAHTFLSFGFRDGTYLAVSVEVRKEVGEAFSPIAGIYRSYELAYVIGSERDLIGLRATHRKDQVYLYRLQATPEQARALFGDMLERAQRLGVRPEFYNTLTSTCTTNIVAHVRRIWPGRIPRSLAVLFPGYADRLANDIGLIGDEGAFDAQRARHRIDERARAAEGAQDFSAAIRAGL